MDFIGAYSPDNLSFLMEGLGMTLRLALLAIALSFIFGCLIGAIRYARVPVLSQVLGAIVGTIRNLPLLLLIFFARFGLPELGLPITPFWSAILALTVFEAAMISELVRSGLQSVEKGLVEAARASGLSYMQTLWHIVLPIGLRRMVPPIVSQFISLLKDTSLVVIVSLAELMHNAKIIMADFDFVFPILILVASIYFLVNYTLSQVARRLETPQH
ncbi:glutamine ABC transporter permease [Paenibacillus darwinianus]|uniref:Glutamine ABC transporter permease n=1 Tax=Paenibacillus darwinianus TaxID=1380763 RepID=A0A9W5S0X4_9BACL|nr:amino acid ABC transporter permease [Paenibacillus darwinianus]EXX86772.1 glutamine ABC transporter permease [Paenibacillus darwinianus]EXX87084.1 glutamine ABC transporter permease [Paenibacillus darwinianus]EXX87278.1 glutamine ABC transporter permease [Paenibacillus darwinianus]